MVSMQSWSSQHLQSSTEGLGVPGESLVFSPHWKAEGMVLMLTNGSSSSNRVDEPAARLQWGAPTCQPDGKTSGRQAGKEQSSIRRMVSPLHITRSGRSLAGMSSALLVHSGSSEVDKQDQHSQWGFSSYPTCILKGLLVFERT